MSAAGWDLFESAVAAVTVSLEGHISAFAAATARLEEALPTDAQRRELALALLETIEREDGVELAEVRSFLLIGEGLALARMERELLEIEPGAFRDLLARPLFESDLDVRTFVAKVSDDIFVSGSFHRAMQIAWDRDEMGKRTHYRDLVRRAMPALQKRGIK